MSQTNASDAKTDLAPFEIWEVMLDNSTIKFHKPLVLQPQWMPDDPDEPDENEYLQVIVPTLNIDVYADNGDDLWDVVHSEIRFVWNHIVQIPDYQLNKECRAIKRNYLAIAEEVSDG